MALMTWTTAMSVGVPELDADHRTLIRIINQLAESSEGDDAAASMRQCLYALLRYAEFHFAREEKVLTACHYPGMDHHKGQHREFTDHMQDLAKRLDEEDLPAAEVINEELLVYLKDWLNHHILIEDMSYRKLAESNPSALRAAKEFRASEIWWTAS